MPNPAHNYQWDADSQRYRDARTGTFASQRTVTMLLNRQVTVAQKEMRNLGKQLQDEAIDINEWRDGMRAQLKVIHATQAAKAIGSFDQMTPAEWGRVGGKLKYQYGKLENFAQEIDSGTQPLDGRFAQRVDMYAKSGFATYEATRGEVANELGYDEERNMLGNAEHCDGCLEETAKGWVRIGTLVPIGKRECRVNDQCHIIYRNSRTGEMVK